MNLIKKSKIIFGSYEKAYEIILTELKDYDDVEGLENLINLISSLHKENYIFDFYDVIKGILNSYDYTHANNPMHNSKNNFIKIASTQLESHRVHIFPTKHLITLTTVESVLNVVEFNFYFFSNGKIKSVKDVSGLIFDGNIILPLTFFVEDFKEDFPLPKYSEEFFHRLSNMKFDGKKSKQLHNDILWNYLFLIMAENNISQRFNNTICISAKYLMACNALKHGRDSIICEDVVVGYTTALRLLTDDIREYVIKFQDNNSNLKISDFEYNDDDLKKVKDNGLGFKGVVSIIFAILAFFEVLFIIIYIKEIFAPGMPFTNNPILRLGSLAVCVFIAKKFYNYLTQGSDKDLFEDGKSIVMLIFIIIFIITVIIGITMF